MARSRPGVMIYFETGKAIKSLDYETKGRLFEAIMEYAEFGAIPEFEGILAAVWPFVADKIDRDIARYEEIRQTRAEAGRKGGLASASKRNQDEAKEANASFVKQIKPPVTTPVAGTVAGTVDAAETSIKCSRENEERENGATSRTANSSQVPDDDFEARKKASLEMVVAYGGR